MKFVYSSSKRALTLLALSVSSSFPVFAQSRVSANPTNLQLLDRAIAKSANTNRVAVDDMLFPRERFLAYRSEVAKAETGGTRSALYSTPYWTEGRIYYSFDAGLPSAQRTAFTEAAREWEKWANVKFAPRTTQANYIRVYQDSGGGSFSYIGMVGGVQDMSLASWGTKWTACHEIEHALGAMHEQCRSDRGSYISINFANIQADAADNFAIVSGSLNKGTYDFDSVMHYYSTAFAVDPNKYTIVCKPAFAAFQDTMGQRDHLSDKDKAGIVSVYGAPNTTSTYSLAGAVSLGSTPLSGVSLSLSNGVAQVANSSGAFVFSGVAAGNYTLTPSKTGYSFSPSSRSVALSGNQTGLNFAATAVTQAAASTISISSAAMVEGHAGAPYMTFNVSLSRPSTQTITVNFQTVNGNALAGSDYTARTGTLTFRAGSTEADVRVALLPDTVLEGNETFSVVLSNPVGATLGVATGKGTIINDDRASDAEEAPNNPSSSNG